MNGPKHVAIVGGSGSGKTWLAKHIASMLAPRVAHISLDDFYRDLSLLSPVERDRVNFDDPAAIDWDCLKKTFTSMESGQTVNLPVYDFATHTRTTETRRLEPVPLVIWDGLWLLHHEWLRPRFAGRIFVQCPAAVRFERRAERDLRERGRSLESVRRQFFDVVEPMHEKFVAPQVAAATRVLTSPPAPGEVDKLLLEMAALADHS